MREIFTKTGYILLATFLVLFEALFWIVAGPAILLTKLFEKIRYEAQCLQYPPLRGERIADLKRYLEAKRRKKEGTSMLEAELVEKIKQACKTYGGESLVTKFDEGLVTPASLGKAYNKIVKKEPVEPANSIATISDFCSECAILCYEMAVKDGHDTQKGKIIHDETGTH